MTITITLGATLSLAGCANDTFLGTAALTETAALPAKPLKPAVDPACNSLAARISELRKDGVVERVEAASKGKTKTVSVKRESLAKVAELEKANAEFQAKCSAVRASAVTPVAPTAAAAAPAVRTAAGLAGANVAPAVAKATTPATTAATAAATKAATKAAPTVVRP